jgi:feruloyl-CoA synthase
MSKSDRVLPAVNVETRPGGTLLLTCPYPPEEAAQSIPAILQTNVALFPDRALLAERDGEKWRTLSYGDAWAKVARVAKTLVDMGVSADTPVAVLCPKSFQHFQMAFGAQLAGVPVSPISAPYSLLSQDHAKLKHIIALLKPRILLVGDLGEYVEALASLTAEGLLQGVTVLHAASFDNWLAPTPSDEWVSTALAGIGHATVARYMFTSGSTGMPKAVIYTQGMMVENMAAHEGLSPARRAPADQGPRVLEWMPWSHTSAGVTRLNGVIANGGTVYFDTGRPVSGEFEETLRNIREVKPTRLQGAPVGLAMLADALEQDDELNFEVFSRLSGLGFGAAAMTEALYDRLQALSVKATAARIPMSSGLGSTEVLGATQVYWPMDHPDNVGLPLPGITIKLVPNAGRLELRVKGGTVTPGYFRDPGKTAESFDEEGFFKMGDAVRFVDADRPEKGLAFDGRIAEQFKLDTGTWVSAGTLRVQVLTATSPYLADVVVCGLNQAFVGILAWPNTEACSGFLNLDSGWSKEERARAIVHSPQVLEEIRDRLRQYNRDNPGSSMRIEKFLLMAAPPSLAVGEMTEKGYVNQRVAQECRAKLVAMLFSQSPSEQVADAEHSQVVVV